MLIHIPTGLFQFEEDLETGEQPFLLLGHYPAN